MKKALLIATLVVLSVGLIFAQAQTEKGAGIKLTVTSWRVEDADSWNRINAEFTKENPNITISYEPITATEYDSVLMASLQSGRAADIMFLRTYGVGRQIFDAGYVIPLSEKDIPNLKALPDSAINPWRTEGGIVYGVPGSSCYGGFFYNKDIFAKYGLTEPQTYAEFLNVCKVLDRNGVTPFAFGIKDSWMVAEYLSGNVLPAAAVSSDWHRKLMNKEVDYRDPAFIKHFEMIKELAQFFPKGYEGIGYNDMQQIFLTERAAIYPVGTWELNFLETTNPDLNLGWFFMPPLKAGDQISANFNMIMGYGINSKVSGEKLEAAKTYLNWLADVKGSELFGNEVIGQFASHPNATKLDNANAADMAARGAKVDKFQQIPYEKLSDRSPDYTAAIGEAVYKLLVDNYSAKQAADFMMNAQSWYFD
ncbi:MAG: ABC transporter substrate-binding protein [Sphaerochaetaceae bacterium]|jgi:raffinose/stachyose/melibiose transport system substrate-binding protein|nr:extracellular solute-binding protein [Sphaerochaetaceae bacterium]HHU89067.1 extracellular solute-binding protein [Spirochaetales bacterium]